MSCASDFQQPWSDPKWLQQYPNALNANANPTTVLDYFSKSRFYDPECNNEILRQQSRDASQLRHMTGGIEYEAKKPAPGSRYFIVRKQRRTEDATELLALYCIIAENPDKGMVYVLPDLHSVLNYNFTTALYYLDSAFSELKAQVEPGKGEGPHTWKYDLPTTGEGATFDGAAKPEVKVAQGAAGSGIDAKGDAGIKASDSKAPPRARDPRNAALVKSVLDRHSAFLTSR